MSDQTGLENETKGHLMITVKMFDGWPYGEFTIEPGYKARGGEQELLKEIVEVLKRWNLSLTPAQKELER